MTRMASIERSCDEICRLVLHTTRVRISSSPKPVLTSVSPNSKWKLRNKLMKIKGHLKIPTMRWKHKTDSISGHWMIPMLNYWMRCIPKPTPIRTIGTLWFDRFGSRGCWIGFVETEWLAWCQECDNKVCCKRVPFSPNLVFGHFRFVLFFVSSLVWTLWFCFVSDWSCAGRSFWICVLTWLDIIAPKTASHYSVSFFLSFCSLFQNVPIDSDPLTSFSTPHQWTPSQWRLSKRMMCNLRSSECRRSAPVCTKYPGSVKSVVYNQYQSV